MQGLAIGMEVRMAHAAPGKSQREGISLMQLVEMFPDEESARLWFEGIA